MIISKVVALSNQVAAIVIHNNIISYANYTKNLRIEEVTLAKNTTDSNNNWIEFITEDYELMQLGFMKRPKGHKVDPHLHNPKPREINKTTEFLQIISGEVKVILYDLHGVKNDDCRLEFNLLENDSILLFRGPHSFEFSKTSVVMELKQGPYAGDIEKVFK